MTRRNENGITMNRAFAKLLSDGSEVERLSARVAELEGVRDELSKIGVDQRTRIAELEAALERIANYAQERSQGPTVFDALWDVRSKALMALCGEVE